jgi:hypothetical protein
VEIREGPVDQEQIQIIKTEVRQGVFAGIHDIVMPVVPHLGGDVQFFPGNPAGHDDFQGFADVFLVPVNRCAIEVAITDFSCAYHGISDLVSGKTIRSEGSKTDGRDFHPVPGCPERHLTRINSISGNFKFAVF